MLSHPGCERRLWLETHGPLLPGGAWQKARLCCCVLIIDWFGDSVFLPPFQRHTEAVSLAPPSAHWEGLIQMVFIQHARQAPPEMLGAQGVVLLLLPLQLRLTPPWNGGDLPQATSGVPAGPSARRCNALHLPLLIAFGVVFASFPGTASTSRPQPHLGDPTRVTQGGSGAGSV